MIVVMKGIDLRFVETMCNTRMGLDSRQENTVLDLIESCDVSERDDKP